MQIQTIVALTDFSTLAEHALDRAALLAAQHGARLQIMYVAERHNPMFADPQSRLCQRARQLARRHDLAVQALTDCGLGAFASVMRAAARADLLVLDKRAPVGLAGRLRLGLLDRIARASACPVLVVQRPAHAAYRHVLAACDLTQASPRWLQHAPELQPQAALELFHAGSAAPGAALQQVLQQWGQSGSAVRVSDVFEARRNRVAAVLGVGSKARRLAVQQERSSADLLMLGQGGSRTLGDWLHGGMARRVLRKVGCDVLLHPASHQPRAAQRGAQPPQSLVARRCTAAM